jgi:hypothetical protein
MKRLSNKELEKTNVQKVQQIGHLIENIQYLIQIRYHVMVQILDQVVVQIDDQIYENINHL